MLVLVRSIGALVILVAAAVVLAANGKKVKLLGSVDQASPEDRCYPKKPILAVEVLDSAQRGHDLLGQPPAVGENENEPRAAIRDQMHRDFVFIAAYGLLFMAMSLLLAGQSFRGAVWLAAAAGACAVAAAIFDVRENLNILHFLSLSVPTDADARAIRCVALMKWGLIAATMALLSSLFFGRGHWLLTAIGVLFVATAVIGFSGLVCQRALDQIFLPMGPVLVATAFVCFRYPDWLV
jgi:hypothetical protein